MIIVPLRCSLRAAMRSTAPAAAHTMAMPMYLDASPVLGRPSLLLDFFLEPPSVLPEPFRNTAVVLTAAPSSVFSTPDLSEPLTSSQPSGALNSTMCPGRVLPVPLVLVTVICTWPSGRFSVVASPVMGTYSRIVSLVDSLPSSSARAGAGASAHMRSAARIASHNVRNRRLVLPFTAFAAA